MLIPARKYWRIVAAVFVWIAIPSTVLRLYVVLLPTAGSAFVVPIAHTWGIIQWASVMLLALTLPISLIWGIIAASEKEWRAGG